MRSLALLCALLIASPLWADCGGAKSGQKAGQKRAKIVKASQPTVVVTPVPTTTSTAVTQPIKQTTAGGCTK